MESDGLREKIIHILDDCYIGKADRIIALIASDGLRKAAQAMLDAVEKVDADGELDSRIDLSLMDDLRIALADAVPVVVASDGLREALNRLIDAAGRVYRSENPPQNVYFGEAIANAKKARAALVDAAMKEETDDRS